MRRNNTIIMLGRVNHKSVLFHSGRLVDGFFALPVDNNLSKVI